MKNNIISALCIAYGLGYVALHQYGYVSTLNLPQIIAAVGGGVGLLGYNNYSSVLSLFKAKVKVPSTSKCGKIYTPQEFELKDYESMIHLRERLTAAGSQEGLEVLNKLNGIMFSLNEKTPTNTNPSS